MLVKVLQPFQRKLLIRIVTEGGRYHSLWLHFLLLVPLGHVKLASQDQEGWAKAPNGRDSFERHGRFPILRNSKVVSSLALDHDKLALAHPDFETPSRPYSICPQAVTHAL